MQTYNPKKISMSFGTHMPTGYADDSFVSIEPNGDGITKKVGCDGEIVRSVSPDDTYVIKVSFLQGSPTNTWLQNKVNADINSGNGMFPILIKDLCGTMVFKAAQAWVSKPAPRGYGKESSNREWEIQTGSATLAE